MRGDPAGDQLWESQSPEDCSATSGHTSHPVIHRLLFPQASGLIFWNINSVCFASVLFAETTCAQEGLAIHAPSLLPYAELTIV